MTQFIDPAEISNWEDLAVGIPAIELGEGFLSGKIKPNTGKVNDPMSCFSKLEELQPDLGFILNFGNVTVLNTSEGLVLIDGGGIGAKYILYDILNWRPNSKIHTAIYTHGHADHVANIERFERHLKYKFRVIGHRNVAQRFDRYTTTLEYNHLINQRQFGYKDGGFYFPKRYRYPDLSYDSELEITVGNERLVLYHDKGETDDATWVWMPQRKVICAGDLFIWAFPNCGNPQKVQRYPLQWVKALRKMAALEPELLLPGHGPPISGKDTIQVVLTDTANALESVVLQVIELMNRGLPLEDVLQKVIIPPIVHEKIYLKPVYDQPEFVIRNIWRLLAGWWSGTPSELEPPHSSIWSHHLIPLIGKEKAIEKIENLIINPTKDNLAVACNLVFLLHKYAPEDSVVNELFYKVFTLRSEKAGSTMARGIYRYSANYSSSKL